MDRSSLYRRFLPEFSICSNDLEESKGKAAAFANAALHRCDDLRYLTRKGLIYTT